MSQPQSASWASSRAGAAPGLRSAAMDSDGKAGPGIQGEQLLAPNSSIAFNHILRSLIEQHERETGGDAVVPRAPWVGTPKTPQSEKNFQQQPPPSSIPGAVEQPLDPPPDPSSSLCMPWQPDLPDSLPPIVDLLDVDDVGSRDNPSTPYEDKEQNYKALEKFQKPPDMGDNKRQLMSVSYSHKGMPTMVDEKTIQALTGGMQEDFRNSKSWGERIVQSKGFSISSAAVILLNTFYIGVQADLLIRVEFDRVLKGSENPWRIHFFIVDFIFAILFTIELAARFILLKRSFFFGKDKLWHLFDFIIIVSSGVELIGEAMGNTMGSGMSVLRSVRLVRILRLVRLASSIEVIKSMVRSMQTMIHALSGVLSSFVPAIIVLCICIYMMDLVILESVRTYLGRIPPYEIATLAEQENVNLCVEYYANVFAAFFTLLASVTGGYDWTDVSKPLKEINTWYEVFFQFYVIFVMLGVLNVIAGLFVNVATTATSLEQDMIVDEQIKQEHKFIKKLVDLLTSGDSDGDGMLALSELQEYLTDERVKAYFNTLNLDVKCLAQVFNILDPDNRGVMEVSRFAKGCIEFRGIAKNIDLVIINRSIFDLHQKVEYFTEQIESISGSLNISRALK